MRTIVAFFFLGTTVFALSQDVPVAHEPIVVAKNSIAEAIDRMPAFSPVDDADLIQALNMAKSGRYVDASVRLLRSAIVHDF